MSVGVPPQIDRSDIQGNVLRAYGSTYPCTAYVFVGIGEIAGGRAWLNEVADLVSSDEEWRQREAELPPQRRGHVRRAARTRGGFQIRCLPAPVLHNAPWHGGPHP